MDFKEIMTQPSVQDIIEPDLKFVGAYEDAYRVFQKMYPSIKELI